MRSFTCKPLFDSGYTNVNDTFPLKASSGLDRIVLIGIDQDAALRRHTAFIRENIEGTPEYNAVHSPQKLEDLGL